MPDRGPGHGVLTRKKLFWRKEQAGDEVRSMNWDPFKRAAAFVPDEDGKGRVPPGEKKISRC